MLAKALGVNQLLVVVNKLDVTDPPWSQERYEAVKAAVGPFLTRTGFRPKKVPISAGCQMRNYSTLDRFVGHTDEVVYQYSSRYELDDEYSTPKLSFMCRQHTITLRCQGGDMESETRSMHDTSGTPMFRYIDTRYLDILYARLISIL